MLSRSLGGFVRRQTATPPDRDGTWLPVSPSHTTVCDSACGGSFNKLEVLPFSQLFPLPSE